MPLGTCHHAPLSCASGASARAQASMRGARALPLPRRSLRRRFCFPRGQVPLSCRQWQWPAARSARALPPQGRADRRPGALCHTLAGSTAHHGPHLTPTWHSLAIFKFMPIFGQSGHGSCDSVGEAAASGGKLEAWFAGVLGSDPPSGLTLGAPQPSSGQRGRRRHPSHWHRGEQGGLWATLDWLRPG